MKRLIATIFLLVYFVTSSGATIQLHYCMDKLVSWDVNSSPTKKCGTCGMEKKGHKGCCHDEKRFIKIEKEHKASATIDLFPKFSLEISTKLNLYTERLFTLSPVMAHPFGHAPPDIQKVPLYLSYSVFRI